MNKREMKKRIYEIDFAIYELVLFLDTHPTNRKAMELHCEYRNKRAEAIAAYEAQYGDYISTIKDVPATECWKWLKGPWPWENNFMEG